MGGRSWEQALACPGMRIGCGCRRLRAQRRNSSRGQLAATQGEIGSRAMAQPLIPPMVIWVRYFWVKV
jgi:hypothetical protein